jgi:hypothetical protein
VRGYKLNLAMFCGAAFLSNFFLIFLTTAAIAAAQSNLPLLLYSAAMIPIAYGFFDVFKSQTQKRYFLGAAAASLAMSLVTVTLKILFNAFSGVEDTISMFLPISGTAGFNPGLFFISMMLSYNITLLAFYKHRKQVTEYRYFAFYLIPILFYLGTTIP